MNTLQKRRDAVQKCGARLDELAAKAAGRAEGSMTERHSWNDVLRKAGVTNLTPEEQRELYVKLAKDAAAEIRKQAIATAAVNMASHYDACRMGRPADDVLAKLKSLMSGGVSLDDARSKLLASYNAGSF